MPTYCYRNFVHTLSKRISANLDTIEIQHNFEYGPEFEIVMCEVLQNALADKFGITRGYVVDINGAAAGDDIVIFEKSRFPTLAIRENGKFARKEFVPIEATYCYIEAKHTINLEGDDPQSLSHACNQISKVKELCSTRSTISPNQIAPYFNVGEKLVASSPPDFPKILNPMFGVLFARQVRRRKGGAIITNAEQIDSILATQGISSNEAPDLLVLGENNLILPTLQDQTSGQHKVRSPFFIPGRSAYHTRKVNGIAFGIGFTLIMAALDWINLGVMPWHKIYVNALDIPYE